MRKKRTKAAAEAMRQDAREYIKELEAGKETKPLKTSIGFERTSYRVGWIARARLYDGKEIRGRVTRMEETSSGTRITIDAGERVATVAIEQVLEARPE